MVPDIKYFHPTLSAVICSILILLVACNVNTETYEAVEIDFLHIDSIEPGEWIEVDGVRFDHVREIEKIDTVLFSLPASRITRAADKRDSNYTEPFPSLNIGYILADYLSKINRDDTLNVDHGHTYIIMKPSLLYSLGKLQIVRSDSSKIEIETSENYPVAIRPISLDD